MHGKPSETLQELTARIHQDTVVCDFASTKDPQNDALRSRFICSTNNKAVITALFKVKDDELDFTRLIEIASDTEDAAKVRKDTVHGTKPSCSKVFSKKQWEQAHNKQISLLLLW